MPGRITELSETQIIADLLRDHRRQAAAQTLVQMPQPAKDTFTVASTPATTYQLNAIPYQGSGGSSLNLSLNGVELVEGVDYTVDYTTALVTVSATLKGTPTPADVLTADYWTTGDLIAHTGAADFGGISDNFNRPDNSSTMGTTSDGQQAWTTTSTNNVPWGISSNTAKMFGGGGEDAQAYLTCQSADGIVQATLATLDNQGGALWAGPMFRWSDHSNYWFIQCKDVASAAQIIKVVAGAKAGVGSFFTTTVGDVVTVTLSGGSISVAVNGTTVSTISDSFNQTAVKHGMYSETQVSHFDNWSFSA